MSIFHIYCIFNFNLIILWCATSNLKQDLQLMKHHFNHSFFPLTPAWLSHTLIQNWCKFNWILFLKIRTQYRSPKWSCFPIVCIRSVAFTGLFQTAKVLYFYFLCFPATWFFVLTPVHFLDNNFLLIILYKS